MLTDEEIEEIMSKLESAFKPLRCVVEVWDYKQRLRFKVFDHNDRGIIDMPEIVLRNLNSECCVQDLIQHARLEIQNMGFVLS